MNKKLRVAGFGLLLGASAFGLSGCTSPFGQTVAQPEKPQTAIVDYEIIVNQHPKVAEAKAKMEKEYEAIQGSMTPEELAKLSPEDRQKRIAETQKMISDKEVEFFKPIEQNVNDSIDAVMQEKGIKILFDKRAVIRGGEDVTKDVLIKEGVSSSDAERIVAGIPKPEVPQPVEPVDAVAGVVPAGTPVVPQ